MVEEIKTFAQTPRISVITPLYEPAQDELEAYFHALLELNGYMNIEVCLVNDGTDSAVIDTLIATYQARFPDQIKYQKNKENKGIASASNDALALATGTYVAFIDQDDTIAPHAFFEYVAALQTTSYDFFYSDEDMLSPAGKRCNPNFKPDWSPHTLLSRMYVNHLSMYKKSIVEQVGGLRSDFDGAQDYDLLLRAAVHFTNVYHAPKMLYHWRASEASIAANVNNKSYIYERAEKAITEQLARLGLEADVSRVNDYLLYDINVRKPKASVETIVFHVQNEAAEALKSWNALIANLQDDAVYTIYVIDPQHQLLIPQVSERIDVREVADIRSAIESIQQIGATQTSHVLFLSSKVRFIDNQTLGYLSQLMQIPDIGVLAPSVVNDDMIITEAGRIICSEDTLAYASYGVRFGENDYFGNNLSLVNYSFVSPFCCLINADLLSNIQPDIETENFMELIITLREHIFFYCVNVGNRCVQHIKNNFERTYKRVGHKPMNIAEQFYNKTFVQALGLSAKAKK